MLPFANAVLGLNDAGEIARNERPGTEIPITIPMHDRGVERCNAIGDFRYERVNA